MVVCKDTIHLVSSEKKNLSAVLEGVELISNIHKFWEFIILTLF